jgi:ATP-binding cassette subfamily F protein uup
MPLLQLRQITLRYSSAPLLDRVDFQVDAGERICLLGRNGAGKTSLMRIITGEETPNDGEVIQSSDTRMTRLSQEIPGDMAGSVREVIHAGLRPDRHEEEWQSDVRIEELMEEMKLPPDREFSALSGGLKRRVLLARALAGQPDILLLDEPTNHLDLDSILWLERFLLAEKRTLFFVTHDRAFLRRLATRIVELDRGRLTSWACDYDTYLVRKAANLEAEEKQWAAFDKKLAQEEAWLRQGVKARRTRNEGRVRALQAMRTERSQRRQREGAARIEVQAGALSGQKVIEAKAITFGFGAEPVIRDFSTTIWRGDKIGLIGPNGGGKTTLLQLLLGRLTPQAGTVKLGTNLQIVYLDQLRGQIDDAKTVAQNVAGDAETVTFQGRARHIHSYLQDFLFRADRIRMPAKMLSGGERNRLLLARLFLQPANVLVLDEPTNDLDAETLELLEELLVDYTGTLLLVSHDRVFLDNVVTGTLVFEGAGRVAEYTGGYEDWLRQREAAAAAAVPLPVKIEAVSPPPPAPARIEKKPVKFLNREKKELEELPAQIEQWEADLAELASRLWEPELYQKQPDLIPQLKSATAALEKRIKDGYARWEELDARRQAVEAAG